MIKWFQRQKQWGANPFIENNEFSEIRSDDWWIDQIRKHRDQFREVKKIMKEKRAMARMPDRPNSQDLKSRLDAVNPRPNFQQSQPQETKQEAGKRYDVGKLRYDLVPVDALKEVVKVYTKGAEKYADRNWEKGMSWSRVVGPLMRHLEAFRQGELIDAETGCYHTAMIAWNAMALCSYHMRNIGTNDLGWEHYENKEVPKDKSE